MMPPVLSPSFKVALVRPSSRILVVARLADALRLRGGTHADVVATIQGVYAEAGQGVPDLATVDAWLSEADEEDAA